MNRHQQLRELAMRMVILMPTEKIVDDLINAGKSFRVSPNEHTQHSLESAVFMTQIHFAFKDKTPDEINQGINQIHATSSLMETVKQDPQKN
jgi:phosphoribosylpyrophosphate synthetase